MDARQADYEERYDRQTIFYDVFEQAGVVSLSGPPLRNLAHPLFEGTWLVDGIPSPVLPTLHDRGRTQESHLALPRVPKELTVQSRIGNTRLRVGESGWDLFSGRRVLVTLSLNNSLVWIRDWATYYAREHGTNAVLFYDNGSTIYSPSQILETLQSVPGIDVAVVVNWKFPYGPGGGPKKLWDSDYCQYSVLEHARLRFLAQADGVISCDIDELVLTEDRRSVYEYAEESTLGAVVFTGRWIEKAVDVGVPAARTPRFTDFWFYNPESAPTTRKWCVAPRRLPSGVQWRVHSLNDLRVGVDPRVVHRHFKGVNTNWKYEREEVDARESGFVEDREIHAAILQHLGPGAVEPA